MRQPAIFIAPLRRIVVPEALGRGDKLDDGMLLTNDMELVRSKMSERLVERIGTLEAESTCRAGLVAYAEVNDDRRPANTDEAEALIAVQLMKLHFFVNTMWLIKDNAASVENGFLDSPPFVSTRIWQCDCCLADGGCTITTFSRDELRAARTLFRNLYDSTHWGETDMANVMNRDVVAGEINPFARALYFVLVGRTTNHSSVRIANYCSALESLLITSPNELTYRLSQRVAWLLGETAEERHDLFMHLKDAYDFRSKAVHGSFVSEKKLRTSLQPAVVACDQLLRNVFGAVLGDEVLREYVLGNTKAPEAFEERLLKITLGMKQTDNS
jgi:hypothetical protein